MSEMEGGCACGRLRYRIEGPPIFVHCCHCTRCQRESGSAFVINALIEATRVQTLTGSAEPSELPSESGAGHTIWRCPGCRVGLWSTYGRLGPRMLLVKAGTLDDPGSCPPGAHIFTRSKLPWLTLADGIPAFETYYDRETLWPAEARKRRNALVG